MFFLVLAFYLSAGSVGIAAMHHKRNPNAPIGRLVAAHANRGRWAPGLTGVNRQERGVHTIPHHGDLKKQGLKLAPAGMGSRIVARLNAPQTLNNAPPMLTTTKKDCGCGCGGSGACGVSHG